MVQGFWGLKGVCRVQGTRFQGMLPSLRGSLGCSEILKLEPQTFEPQAYGHIRFKPRIPSKLQSGCINTAEAQPPEKLFLGEGCRVWPGHGSCQPPFCVRESRVVVKWLVK